METSEWAARSHALARELEAVLVLQRRAEPVLSLIDAGLQYSG